MRATCKPVISKLERAEHGGDWHDKPLRWAVNTNTERQLFSTKREATDYARRRRASANESDAISAYVGS